MLPFTGEDFIPYRECILTSVYIYCKLVSQELRLPLLSPQHSEGKKKLNFHSNSCQPVSPGAVVLWYDGRYCWVSPPPPGGRDCPVKPQYKVCKAGEASVVRSDGRQYHGVRQGSDGVRQGRPSLCSNTDAVHIFLIISAAPGTN